MRNLTINSNDQLRSTHRFKWFRLFEAYIFHFIVYRSAILKETFILSAEDNYTKL